MPKLPTDASTIALALLGLTAAAALTMGLAAGTSAALLALVTGGLLGAILLVWHSLRTLAGDAQVDPSLDLVVSGPAAVELRERKQRALRALKDLEQEHSVGKIDDDDFAALDGEYRARAKDVIREIDTTLEPFRAKAEALARSHRERLEKAATKKTPAHACSECGAKNDEDATFCKKCGVKLS